MTIEEARALKPGEKVHYLDRDIRAHLEGTVERVSWNQTTRTLMVWVRQKPRGHVPVSHTMVDRLHRPQDCPQLRKATA